MHTTYQYPYIRFIMNNKTYALLTKADWRYFNISVKGMRLVKRLKRNR